MASTPADLAAVVRAAAAGSFPPDDGTVHVVSDPIGPASGVIAFSAHFWVCAPVTAAWVADHVDTDDFTATHSPGFLLALADHIGAEIGALDVVLAGTADTRAHEALADLRSRGLVERGGADHPRVVRARRYRRDVRAWEIPDGGGTVSIGRGVGGRWEASFELARQVRGTGRGRALAAAARALVPDDEPTFVQVAPGNVASLRAVLAAGYHPVGSEVLLPGA